MTDNVTQGPWDYPTSPRDTSQDRFSVDSEPAKVVFHAKRRGFFSILFTGLLLMVPTLGLYRFWLVTRKRRFYWNHTDIDGDALEYTGTPLQLLIGFLLAILIFLPVYGVLFVLSLQASDLAVFGYIAVGVIFYFLTGYAAYRSRRFRLSRTFWRGIRFQQTGNAWVYAFKRFLWTIASLATLGLTYPLMTKSLWKYRITHTWYGDRQFEFTGTLRQIAGPFYGTYALVALLVGVTSFRAIIAGGDESAMSEALLIGIPLVLLVGYLGYLFVTTRIQSRFWSSVKVGEARLNVRVRARSIFLQHLLFSVALTLMLSIIGVLGLLAIGIATSDLAGQGAAQDFAGLAQTMQLGAATFFLLIGLYLAMLGLWGLLSELILAFGFWKIVSGDAEIVNVESLRTVRAAGAESPLGGEGLADALNVGAY